MNITSNNINSNAFLKTPYSKKPMALDINISGKIDNTVNANSGFKSYGNVVVEFSGELKSYTNDELYELANQGSKWKLNGEYLNYDDMNTETKTYLKDFRKVRSDLGSGVSFGDLATNLGNAYASKREELTGQYSGDELNGKLEKLENAFNMYTETRVVGDVGEVGSMANKLHFKMEYARMTKNAIIMGKALAKGENLNDIKKVQITKNDDEYFKSVLENAKKTLRNVTQFFNKNGVIKNKDDLQKLFSYTGSNSDNDDWTLNKLDKTFEMFKR